MTAYQGMAIIGGTGLDAMGGLETLAREPVHTPVGQPSSAVTHGRFGPHTILFLARHGDDHAIAPHQVNYRANLWALKSLGARSVIAVNAVGGIRDDLIPGTVVIPDQIIDYTAGRASSYFEAGSGPVPHIDFTHPYDRRLRAALCEALASVGLPDPARGAVHGVTEGPRLETAAEIDRLQRDGCDIVGMTGMPEAALARELGLAYACCAVVVNRAAGRGARGIHEQLADSLPTAMARVERVLRAALDSLATDA